MVQYSKAIEKIIERAEARGGAAASPLLGQMQNIASATRALEGVMMNRNPVDTDAGHLKKVNQAGDRLAKSLEAAKVRGTEALNSAIAKLAGEMQSRTGLRPAENMGEVVQQSEIRQAMLRLSPDARSRVVQEALSAGDVQTLNALANGAPFLSGVSKLLIEQTISAFQQQRAPEISDQIDAVLEVDHALQAALGAASRAASEARDERAMQKILMAEAAAKSAEQAFGEAIKG